MKETVTRSVKVPSSLEILDVTMPVCSCLHMLSEIGIPKNVRKLGRICIPLAMQMSIQINLDPEREARLVER